MFENFGVCYGQGVAELTKKLPFSLPTKVFILFALIIIAFSSTLFFALSQTQKTLQDLTLNSELLPIVSELFHTRYTQESLIMTLETVPEQRSDVIHSVRKIRPANLMKNAEALRLKSKIAREKHVALHLKNLALELEDSSHEADALEPDYREMYHALLIGDQQRADGIRYSIRERERNLEKQIRSVQESLNLEISIIAGGIHRTQSNLLLALLFLTIGALTISVVLTVLAYRTMKPLSILTSKVTAVGDESGDLSQKVDISSNDEIGVLAQEFNNMLERLREREEQLLRNEQLATIGLFGAKITHEIRNPLNAIMGNTELLYEDVVEHIEPEFVEGPKKSIETILERLEHLKSLTGEYLSYARLPQIKLTSQDVGEILRKQEEFQGPDLEFRGIELSLEIKPDLPPVRLDAGQFGQALTNLLKNAAEAMDDGGHIKIVAGSYDGGVNIEISDDGIGMDRQTLESIFELHFTKKRTGSGLGLPITQQIIINHEGTIQCTSEEGKGTCFTIWLPESQVQAAIHEESIGVNHNEEI